MKKNLITIISALCFVIFGLIVFNAPIASAKNIYKQHFSILNKSTKSNSDKLSLIDKYQEQYFVIIKRNNVLLNSEDDKNLNNDRRELKKLYKNVKKQISNKIYLERYKEIEKKYSKCNEITTTGINDFAENNYKEVDALLNNVYKEVKINLSPEDFKKLDASQQQWLKETENYEKAYNAMDFGTIGTAIYYDYQTNIKSFRTLLLMLYL